MPQKKRTPWISLALIFFAIVFFGMLFVSCISTFSGDVNINGNVALINLNGEITSDGGDSLFGGAASASEVIKFIEEANENPQIKAVLLRINSPGGAPVASEEIMLAVKNSSKPVVALIRDQGTSGAYWAASAADGIVASPISVTGSIGVLGSSLEFSKFMEKYGIGYERLIAGEYKDAGIPFRNLTPQERALLQERLDLIHQYFIKSVAENRGLTYNQTLNLANGLFYIGEQALVLGLVDKLGGQKEAEEMIRQKANLKEITLAEYRRPPSLFDVFAQAVSYYGYSLGRGIGSELVKDEFSVKT